jgi:hypothetical protein
MRDKYNINIKHGLKCANILIVVTFTLILVSFSVDKNLTLFTRYLQINAVDLNVHCL